MYRRSKKYQEHVTNSAYARAELERKQLDLTIPVQTNLPGLRRVIEITDFDSGTPVTHRMGWSRILAALRKAFPRLRQFY